MRIVFIGCVDFSETTLRRVLAHPEAEVVGIVTRNSSIVNADFRSLTPLAEESAIPCLAIVGNDPSGLAAWMRDRRPDVVFCFGWSSLLTDEVLRIPALGTVGYHPALLPRHRGRHPIIWALALGLSETGSTFFFMDEGADSGDILDQERVEILQDDDAAALYARLTSTALQQIDRFLPRLADGSAPHQPQDHRKATYWRKRSKQDGAIDWRMPASGIYNLVRALARPYPGAHFVHRDREVSVWRSRVAVGLPPGAEPGKVLDVSGRRVTVQCGIGAIELIEHGLATLPDKDTYL